MDLNARTLGPLLRPFNRSSQPTRECWMQPPSSPAAMRRLSV